MLKSGAKKKFVATKRVRDMCPAKLQGYRLKELKGSETWLKASMAPHLSKLMSRKRLELFGEMLEDCNDLDTELVNNIKHRFRLSEWLQPSGVFQKRLESGHYDLTQCWWLEWRGCQEDLETD